LEFFFLIIVTTDAFGICFPFALLLIRRGRQNLCGSNSNLKEFSNIVANGVFLDFSFKEYRHRRFWNLFSICVAVNTLWGGRVRGFYNSSKKNSPVV